MTTADFLDMRSHLVPPGCLKPTGTQTTSQVHVPMLSVLSGGR